MASPSVSKGPQLNERQRGPEGPKGKGWLDQLATLFPRRYFSTVLAAVLGAGVGGIALKAGHNYLKNSETTLSDSEKPVDPEHDPVLTNNHHGDWAFLLYRTEQRQISDVYGKTLYAYIKGTLRSQGLLQQLDSADHQPFIEAYIDFVKELNPQATNLDDFSSINGKTLVFPQYVLAKPRFIQELSRKNQGYERVQNMAVADGFPVKDIEQQQANYDKALKNTVGIPDSTNYRFKEDGTDDSPRRLEADVIPRLEKMGEIFKEKTRHTLYITDVLRSPALNANTGGSSKGTTHTTGRTFDISSGRFNDPDGNMITVSVDGVRGLKADFIENILQPALTSAALEAGLLLFAEGTHWHIYAPKNHILDLSKASAATQVVEMVSRPEAQNTFQAALDKAIQQVANRSPESNALQRLHSLDALIQKAVNMSGEGRFHATLCTDDPNQKSDDFCLYDNPSEELLAPHEGKNLAQIQTELEKMPSTAPEYQNLLRVRNQRLRLELIDIIRGMTDEEIVANGIFKGSVVSRFGDIEAAWVAKRDRKVNGKKSEEVGKYYPYVEQFLKTHKSTSMSEWYTQQSAAIGYFKKHATQLGYSDKWLNYLSPSLMAAVIHAEFFSEFSGETYLELIPILFSSHNLQVGPAMGDQFFSLGLVQMTKSTITGLFGNHGDAITAIQAKDPSHKIVVPEMKAYEEKIKIKKGKGKRAKTITTTQTVKEYDHETLVEAMLSESQYFYNVLAVISHITPGMELALEDPKFLDAWNKASEQDRNEWMGSFAAMSINAGPNGAKKIVRVLLTQVDSSTLKEYTEGLPKACTTEYTGKLAAKGLTTSRNARRGRETMDELVERANLVEPGVFDRLVAAITEEEPLAVATVQPAPSATPVVPTAPAAPTPTASPVPTTPQVSIIKAGNAPRASLLKETSALRDRALADGFELDNMDPDVNQKTYEAAAKIAVPVPESTNYYRKADQETEARLDPEALAMFQWVASRFKSQTGYALCFTETLQSPEARAEITRNMDSTSYTGRWLSISDGRFKDSQGKEITWSVPTGKGHYEKGPDAGKVEELRTILVRILEEQQHQGNLLALTADNGGYQVYFPKAEQEEQEDSPPTP